MMKRHFIGFLLASLIFITGVGLFALLQKGQRQDLISLCADAERTPEYTLNQIAIAVKTHDLALFRKYIDFDMLSNKLADSDHQASIKKINDLALSKIDTSKWDKPSYVEAVKQHITKYVETGEKVNVDVKWLPEKSEETNRHRILIQIVSVNLLQDYTVNKLYPTIDVDKENRTAIARVEVYNSRLKKPQIVELKFYHLANCDWRLCEITNASQLFEE